MKRYYLRYYAEGYPKDVHICDFWCKSKERALELFNLQINPKTYGTWPKVVIDVY